MLEEHWFLPVGLRRMPPIDMARARLLNDGYAPAAVRAWSRIAKELLTSQVMARLEERVN